MGATRSDADDVRQAARLALPHRRRRDPFDAPGLDEEALDEALRQAADGGDDPDGGPAGRAVAPGPARRRVRMR